MTASISRPDLLLIKEQEPMRSTFGCNQEWFAEHWQRQAGCGPCTAATILYYLANSRSSLDDLYTAESHNREGFTCFMADIWHFVTPGHMGVNEATILADGVVRYAAGHGVILRSEIQKVPPRRKRAAPFPDFVKFIQTGLESDCPVAFLNLSNGRLPNLDSWHWVTITALSENGDAVVSDSGQRKLISLQSWYQSSWLGGAAVWFTVVKSPSASLIEDPGQG